MELPSAIPYAFRFRPNSTALVIVDMQRDFLEPGGFGSIQCGDDKVFNRVRRIVPVVQRVLEASRRLGLHVMHTREGHLPDLSDLPASKRLRQMTAPNGHHTTGIGQPGPMGRLLVRGEYGHDIIDELRPLPGEVVIDKLGKGSFWKTGFHRALLARGITHLLLAGVTTECCVNTTAREAADRGFECCILKDCTSGFDATLVKSANDTICAYDGLFGYVGASSDLVKLCESQAPLPSVDVAVAQEDLSILALSQAYREDLIRPVDIARIVCERASKHQHENTDVQANVESLNALLRDAEILQQKFDGRPFPPLYGIPFTVDNLMNNTSRKSGARSPQEGRDNRAVEALINAGAMLLETLSEPLALVADRTVSFALEPNSSSNAQSGALQKVTIFHPTPFDDMNSTHQELQSTSIVAQSSDEARKVWLVIEQDLDHQDDTSARSQTAINSRVWHVDFRGPRSGGFTFGTPKAWNDCSCSLDVFHHAAERLKTAGGQAQEVDWEMFEQVRKATRDLSLLAAAETVSMKAILELQAKQTRFSRQAKKILESVDVLLVSMVACSCHPERVEQNNSLIDSLNLCAVTIGTRLALTQREGNSSAIMLICATGRDGRILDIAREVEREIMLHGVAETA